MSNPLDAAAAVDDLRAAVGTAGRLSVDFSTPAFSDLIDKYTSDAVAAAVLVTQDFNQLCATIVPPTRTEPERLWHDSPTLGTAAARDWLTETLVDLRRIPVLSATPLLVLVDSLAAGFGMGVDVSQETRQGLNSYLAQLASRHTATVALIESGTEFEFAPFDAPDRDRKDSRRGAC